MGSSTLRHVWSIKSCLGPCTLTLSATPLERLSGIARIAGTDDGPVRLWNLLHEQLLHVVLHSPVVPVYARW